MGFWIFFGAFFWFGGFLVFLVCLFVGFFLIIHNVIINSRCVSVVQMIVMQQSRMPAIILDKL